jgi:hypothetical protein
MRVQMMPRAQDGRADPARRSSKPGAHGERSAVIPRRSGGDVSITVILEFQDAIEKYDRAMQLMPELADQPGRRSHICARTPDGFVVVEMWDTCDAFERYTALLFPVLAEVGLQAEPRALPVHHVM